MGHPSPKIDIPDAVEGSSLHYMQQLRQGHQRRGGKKI